MTLALYEPGDTVYYPRWTVPSDKTMVLKDRQVHVYPATGKLYVDYLWDNLLETVVQEMHENVDDEFDNITGIVGGEGTGKSNLAYRIAKLYDPDFDMEKSLVNNFKDLVVKIVEDPPPTGAVIWLDEATAVSNNREWNTQDAKDFVKLLETYRSRRWCIILCIPLKKRLDIYLREARLRYLFDCSMKTWEHDTELKRGYFHLTRMNFRAANSDYQPEIKVGWGKYPKMDAKAKELYDKLKGDTQDVIAQEMYDRRMGGNRIDKLGRINRKMLLKLYEDGMNYEEISEFLGGELTPSTIKGYLSQARKERQ